MFLQPIGQTLLRRPMRMLPTVGTDNETGNMNGAALKVERQSVGIDHGFVRDPVIANERIGEDEDLAAIGRIGQGFGIADHAGVEDDFAGGGNGGPEGAPFNRRNAGIVISLLQIQDCGVALRKSKME